MLRFIPFLLLLGCTRMGPFPGGVRGVLAEDARTLAVDDPAAPGHELVEVRGTTVGEFSDGVPIVLYQPVGRLGPRPGIVFLPARAAPESQYESYGRALASRGYVVAMRGWYGFFRTDPELAADARKIAHWLVDKGLVDPRQLGIAGHSMGGKASIMAALVDTRFHAVIAIDPDENGYTHVARGPIARLRAPLLVIGAEDATKGWKICATPNGHYRKFFDHAPPGTIELTLKRADHVQFMDKPDGLGMGICRVGAADSRVVRTVTRGALVQFLEHHLRAIAAGDLPSGPAVVKRVKPPLTSAMTH